MAQIGNCDYNALVSLPALQRDSFVDVERRLTRIEHLTAGERERQLRPLLDHLAHGEHPAVPSWCGWQIERIDGGWCSLLYRAICPDVHLTIKFTMRDDRDRAGREYSALRALDEAGLDIAPKAFFLDRDSYAQPVVVNIRNYLRQPGPWASVDWEYSGWGDPAFDVAQWATHASYTDVPAASCWEWALDAYCRRADERGFDDPTLALRLQVYLQTMVMWWAVRLARYLYEIPAGLDRRLVPWPEDWKDGMRSKYDHYLQLAERCPLTR